jgi:hypothetical protein
MTKQNPKDATLNIKLPQSLKDRLWDVALRKSLDVSTFARMLIAEGLERHDGPLTRSRLGIAKARQLESDGKFKTEKIKLDK